MIKNKPMASKSAWLSIDSITVDSRLQIRQEMNHQALDEYRALYESGDEWPFDLPLTVFDTDDKLYLADGFHRLEAAKRANRDKVNAHVRTGTFDDAFRFALSANSAHGLSRTSADKRTAVNRALADKSISKLSNRKIAELCAVSEKLVRTVKADLANLDRFEIAVAKGLDKMREVLIEINDRQLYKETHDTFVDYCRENGFDDWLYLLKS